MGCTHYSKSGGTLLLHKAKYPIAYGGMCTPPSETTTVITPSQKTINALPHEMTVQLE